MRYLLDTHIFLYVALDNDYLDTDVMAILQDYDNSFYISAETLKELVVGYYNRSFSTKKWKTCEDLVNAVTKDFGITVLPIDEQVMQTYSRLRRNEAQGHKDPSDHVIISHAITLGLPLISSDTRFPFYEKQGLKLIFNRK
ncbi:MAG: type II toxin-antitoxin system VapC family toxin [Paludibacteraceae bacterium]|nr:type II toxin-antitoxin system VapC family toxin [Paludibacteraceae bacterium]